MKCRDCKWCYTNETMGNDLYICVNGHSENFGEYTGLCCEDDCEDGEEESMIYKVRKADLPLKI